MSHGVVYGIVTEENPLHIKTAKCPYISEIDGDTVTLKGECAWTDGEDTSSLNGAPNFRQRRATAMARRLSLEGPVSSLASKAVTHLNVR